MIQEYTSAETSINSSKPARVFTAYQRNIGFRPGSVILDYGGGRFDIAAEYMRGFGCEVKVYDPFNRSEEHNRRVLSYFFKHRPDYITCSNVLNVIKEKDVVESVLANIRRLSASGTIVVICVYEGNGTGHGAATSKGWQRNQKMDSYLPIIRRYFPNVIKRYGLFISQR